MIVGALNNLIARWLVDSNFKDELPESQFRLVAAGDPTKIAPINEIREILPQKFGIGPNENSISDYHVFQVSGNSMHPLGIENGDLLLTKEIHGTEDLHTGDFLVIAVDESVNTEKTLVYDFKLRQFLLSTKGEDVNTLIDRLKAISPEMNLEKYQNRLKEKYQKAIKRYPNRELVVSITYKEGTIDYSFHSSEFVRYRAEFYKRAKDLNVMPMPAESKDDE